MYISTVKFYSNYAAVVSRDGAGSCVIFEDYHHVIIFRVDMTSNDDPVILHESYYTENTRLRFAEALTDLLTPNADERYFQMDKTPVQYRNRYIDDAMHAVIVESVKSCIEGLVKAGML